MEPVNVKIKVGPDGIEPAYQTPGAAAFDIFAANETTPSVGTTFVVETDVAFEIPEDHVMLIFSRSGQGFKENTRLSNCVGVIDSDYRGTVKVKLKRDDDFSLSPIKKGDRIAQGIVLPIPCVIFEKVKELSTTDRGQGGLGSTGK